MGRRYDHNIVGLPTEQQAKAHYPLRRKHWPIGTHLFWGSRIVREVVVQGDYDHFCITTEIAPGQIEDQITRYIPWYALRERAYE